MTDPPARPTRGFELEVEVPGTPEEVWEAIATGPGISSWFVPAEVEGAPGGEVRMHFGPGMDETGRIEAWEPPARFAYRAPAEGERSLAFEFHVETRSGGTCVVRLVNTGFGHGEDWDADFDGLQAGWRLFLEVLRLGRTHFPGRTAASVLTGGRAQARAAVAWVALLDALGLAAAGEGDRVVTRGAGAPAFEGWVGAAGETMRVLVLEAPVAGLLLLAAEGSGESASVSAYLYCFGEDASADAARVAPEWEAWMGERYPAAAEAGA